MENAELSQARSEVIKKFINIEWMINGIISQHYFKKVIMPFVLEVLYDEYCSFALKRRVLQKIISNIDNQKIQDLNRLNTIRNYFAHCAQEIFFGAEKPSEGQKGIIPDPRNTKKELDFSQLYEEFKKKESSVAKYLFNIFKELGGEFV